MPYIKEQSREELDPLIEALGKKLIDYSAGAYNYAICRLLLRFAGHPPTYARINQIIGVLECAKFEVYRRFASPYEDKKVEENGDLYGRSGFVFRKPPDIIDTTTDVEGQLEFSFGEEQK